MSHRGASPHWESMWSAGVHPGQAFDCSGPSATLVALLKRMGTPAPGSRALVPGCGRGYDCVALAEAGFDQVIGLELSSSATKVAQEYVMTSSKKGKIKIITDDFFTSKLPELEGFDFVWDMTFFCAIDPSVRVKWGEAHHRRIKQGGKLACGMFPIMPGKQGGPPFHVDFAAYQIVLTGFVLEERQDKVSDGEEHRPGGIASLGGGPGTGLSIWVKK